MNVSIYLINFKIIRNIIKYFDRGPKKIGKIDCDCVALKIFLNLMLKMKNNTNHVEYFLYYNSMYL